MPPSDDGGLPDLEELLASLRSLQPAPGPPAAPHNSHGVLSAANGPTSAATGAGSLAQHQSQRALAAAAGSGEGSSGAAVQDVGHGVAHARDDEPAAAGSGASSSTPSDMSMAEPEGRRRHALPEPRRRPRSAGSGSGASAGHKSGHRDNATLLSRGINAATMQRSMAELHVLAGPSKQVHAFTAALGRF